MIKVSVPRVDGSLQDWTEPDSLYARLVSLRNDGYSGKQLADELLGDDWGCPPSGIRLTGTLDDGTEIDDYIPYT
jgi:hypothetical protein